MRTLSLAPDALAQLRARASQADVGRAEDEHDALWAEAHRLTRARSRTRPTTSRPVAPANRFDGVLDELRAARAGKDLGQRFAGDPFTACRVLGIRVERVQGLQNPSRPAVTILGRHWALNGGLIQLSSAQSPAEERRTLAHELAHSQGIAEAWCDAFARAFLAEQPERPEQTRTRAEAEWARLRGGAK